MPETPITVKEYIDSRLNDLERRIEQARSALEKSTDNARQGMDRRLDAMNEFRNALSDQVNRSPTREEVDNQFKHIEDELTELNTFKDSRLGIPTKLDVLEARLDVNESRMDKASSTLDTLVLISKIIGGAVVVAIVSLIFAILTHQLTIP